jgi:hypothetical protein
MKRIEKEFEKFEELSPRNAFLGGKTNSNKIEGEVKENEIYRVFLKYVCKF